MVPDFDCAVFNLVIAEGDPHILVPVSGSEKPVCFEVSGDEGQVFEFFGDSKSGKSFSYHIVFLHYEFQMCI